ncbi:MAG TPA: adenylate/guanylate cyclase domain-containing protein [Saprospiraceae bacterium]|nr:adenylate/guanylate cyclase domain-containing protein [Saprospiraceae bacterium]HMP23504.1 adenylate/guanylate cyclase domain-containing protein [Saprospiraceae bacterium]
MKNLLIFLLLIMATAALGQTSTEELEQQLKDTKDSRQRLSLLYELGEAYLRSDANKARDYGRQSHQLAIDLKNNGMAAQTAYLTANAYERLRDDRNTEIWLRTTLTYAKLAGDSDLIINSVNKRSKLATKDRNYRKAYEVNQEAFDYFSGKGTSISDLERKYEVQKAQIEKDKRELEQEKNRLEREINSLSSERDQLSTDKTALEARQSQLVRDKERVEKEITVKEEALVSVSEEKEKVAAIAKEREEEAKKMTREALEQKAVAEAVRAELAEANLAAERNQNLRNLAIIGSAFLLLVSLLSYGRYRSSRRSKKVLEDKNKIIEQERQNSDNLLLNILPKPIADELKQHGKARAQRFEQVTVLLTDFKNFTQIAEKLGPEELVNELDKCFKAFDFIIQQYPDIEKIKTIGDAYMCASGLTNKSTFPDNMIRAALEMQQFLAEQKQENSRLGRPYFEARIGIHTGPVVAGVVGVKKFAYDIWGDTVNIAARMEASCEEGEVNISQTTYQWVAARFECLYRGKVEAKNKGAIDMYYVKRELAGAMAV